MRPTTLNTRFSPIQLITFGLAAATLLASVTIALGRADDEQEPSRSMADDTTLPEPSTSKLIAQPGVIGLETPALVPDVAINEHEAALLNSLGYLNHATDDSIGKEPTAELHALGYIDAAASESEAALLSSLGYLNQVEPASKD